MKSFYTNVQVFGSKILYRGIENGKKVRKKVEYYPTLFVKSNNGTKTEYTTIHNEYVSPIKPGTIRDCRDFVNKYKDIDNFKIYGNQKYEYAYISDLYENAYISDLYENAYISDLCENAYKSGHVDWDRDYITTCNIDIEVGSENGFPDPIVAEEPITAITMKIDSKFLVFGCGEYNNTSTDVRYFKCRNEIDLIKRFIDEWSGNYPDIITGWNIKFFDIPYIVNRVKRLLGDAWAKRLSPWNVLNERTLFIMGKEQRTYIPLGIGILDYIELYKKFAPGGASQESYKLDAISHYELGEKKLSYEEYGNLHNLYKEDYQKFIDYNIRDVLLVEKLDDKLKLIDLALTLAYDSKSNYDDVFAQVRMWDNIIFNQLKPMKKVIPPNESHSKDGAYVGAYVKDPLIGMHKWVVSFDLTSLYPHLIMQYNISPDKFVSPENYTYALRNLLSKNTISVDAMLNKSVDTSCLKNTGVTLTPNGQFFYVDEPGFLSKIMEDMYNDRSVYKDKAIEAKKELEKVLAEIERRNKV